MKMLVLCHPVTTLLLAAGAARPINLEGDFRIFVQGRFYVKGRKLSDSRHL